MAHGPDGEGGGCNDYQPTALDALGVCCAEKLGWKHGIFQPGIDPGFLGQGCLFRAAEPQDRVMAVAAELAGQGSAPGTGADDGCVHFVSPLLKKYVFRSWPLTRRPMFSRCRKIARALRHPDRISTKGLPG